MGAADMPIDLPVMDRSFGRRGRLCRRGRCKCERRNDRENPNHPAPAHCPDLQTLALHKGQMQTPALQFHCYSAAVSDLCRPFRLRERNHGKRGAGWRLALNTGRQEQICRDMPSSLSNFRFSEMSGHIAVDDRLARPCESSCRAAVLLRSCDDCLGQGERHV